MSYLSTRATASSLGAVLSLTTDDMNVVTPDGAGNIDLTGAHGLNTSGAVANTASVQIDNTITLGDLANVTAGNPSLTISTGDITFSATNSVGNINFPITVATTGAAGVITVDGDPFIHNYGNTNSLNRSNLFVGRGAGNFTNNGGTESRNVGIGGNSLDALTSGTLNVGVGTDSLGDLTTGAGNSAVGSSCMFRLTTGLSNTGVGMQVMGGMSGVAATGNQNCALGRSALLKLTTGNGNIAIGGGTNVMGNEAGTLHELLTGSFNIAIGGSLLTDGTGTGSNYTGAESSNILFGHATLGTTGESNTMRLGTTGSGDGQVNRCFLAGTYNVSPPGGSVEVMVMDANGQTGTVTNNMLTTVNTDSGSASPSSGTLTIAGGTNANTSGSGSTVTVNVDTSMTGMVEIEGQAGQLLLKTFDDDSSTLVLQGRNDLAPATVDFITITNNFGAPTCDLDDTVTKAGGYIYRAGGTDVPVTDGGSGRSSATAYAVLCGGTTSTGAHQSIASVGTSGQVLTSNGAGALPTMQDLPPATSAFLAYNSAGDPNQTGAGTPVTVDFDTEVFDVGSDFAADTFTAPVTGNYLLGTRVRTGNITAAMTDFNLILITSNRNYSLTRLSAGAAQTAGNIISGNGSTLADMDAMDTATVQLTISNGAGDTASITGSTALVTYFYGQLSF